MFPSAEDGRSFADLKVAGIWPTSTTLSLNLLNKAIGLAIFATVIIACGGCGGHPASQGQTVRVTERDFRISVSPRRVSPGDVHLTVRNLGPVSHELIVVRSRAAQLPFRSDDVTVDEDAIEHKIPGALEPGNPGTERTLDLHLEPGHYELICNMGGHYLNGMAASLEVG